MTCPELVWMLREREIRVEYRGGQLYLGPREAVTEEIKALVARWRPLLLWAVIRRRPVCPERPAHEIWLRPELHQEWMTLCHQAERRAAREEAA
jgi:hypothetical protein